MFGVRFGLVWSKRAAAPATTGVAIEFDQGRVSDERDAFKLAALVAITVKSSAIARAVESVIGEQAAQVDRVKGAGGEESCDFRFVCGIKSVSFRRALEYDWLSQVHGIFPGVHGCGSC
jgi:hypothetical protein